jgi:catechol 1,2-dioxygenase
MRPADHPPARRFGFDGPSRDARHHFVLDPTSQG